MECPYCGKELLYDDYYGKYLGNGQWEKFGEIYKCGNEDCEAHGTHFHTDKREELHEGYPC